jgi:hypothetical protein
MVDRNYLAEAHQILSGESMKLPEKAHLEAVTRQLAEMNQNLLKMGELLLVILDDNRVPSMLLPASALAKVRQSGLMPVVQTQADGAVVVRAVAVTPPMAKQPTRKM